MGRVLTPLLLASGLLLAAISACQDDSVYRSGVLPPSATTDGGTGDDGSVSNDAGTGTD